MNLFAVDAVPKISVGSSGKHDRRGDFYRGARANAPALCFGSPPDSSASGGAPSWSQGPRAPVLRLRGEIPVTADPLGPGRKGKLDILLEGHAPARKN